MTSLSKGPRILRVARDESGIVASRLRRLLLKAGVSAGGIALAPSSARAALPAGAAARVQGPIVWRDLDQAALDAAYDQSQYAPNFLQILSRYSTGSEAVRRRLGSPRKLAYGPARIETVDVYRTTRPNAPVNVFLHGGAWRNGLAQDYAFPAEIFVRAGAHLVIPDFSWVHEVGGNLQTVADQVRRALAWTFTNASSFGGDPDRLYVSGHSSGAHFAGILLTTDWEKDFGLSPDIIKGGLCCSGIFDLKAPRLSARSSYVRFTDEVEESLSPQRHLDRLTAPLIVAHGSLETPEFQRQSREFAAAVGAAGKRVELLVGAGYNHFEIIETLANPYGLLGRAVLEQMRLSQVH